MLTTVPSHPMATNFVKLISERNSNIPLAIEWAQVASWWSKMTNELAVWFADDWNMFFRLFLSSLLSSNFFHHICHIFSTIEINTGYRFIYSCFQFTSCFFLFLLILFLSIVPFLFSSEIRSTSSSREEESNAALRSDTPTLSHTSANESSWGFIFYSFNQSPRWVIWFIVSIRYSTLTLDILHMNYCWSFRI